MINTKEQNMVKLGQQVRLDKNEILKLYTKGYKKPQDYKLAIELERLPIDTSSHKTVDYWGNSGVKYLLEKFAILNHWDYINDENI